MRKRQVLLLAVLLIGALPVAAQSPCSNGVDLAWLSEPAPAPAPAVPAHLAWLLEPAPEPAAAVETATAGTTELASAGRKPRGPARKPGRQEPQPGGNLKSCTVTEDCNELADISCSGQTCSAVSRDCSPGSCERGSVTCDGVTTQCSQVCPRNCTFTECRQPCLRPGCTAACVNTCTCECETICQ